MRSIEQSSKAANKSRETGKALMKGPSSTSKAGKSTEQEAAWNRVGKQHKKEQIIRKARNSTAKTASSVSKDGGLKQQGEAARTPGREQHNQEQGDRERNSEGTKQHEQGRQCERPGSSNRNNSSKQHGKEQIIRKAWNSTAKTANSRSKGASD